MKVAAGGISDRNQVGDQEVLPEEMVQLGLEWGRGSSQQALRDPPSAHEQNCSLAKLIPAP